MQLARAELPAGELEFVGQAMQLADPVDVLYFPATHAVHVPPAGPEDPVLQVQLVKAALPTGELEFDGQVRHVELAEAPILVEYVPVPQFVHRPDPVNALYFPATHAEHVPPSGPAEPALQVQFVKEVLPTGALEVSAVKFAPCTMRLAMAEVAFVSRYSSITKTPAMSPLK